MYDYLACMNIHIPHVFSAHIGQKMLSETQELELETIVSLPCGSWELNPGPVEEQPVLLTTGPSLQPQVLLLKGVFERKLEIVFYNMYFYV